MSRRYFIYICALLVMTGLNAACDRQRAAPKNTLKPDTVTHEGSLESAISSSGLVHDLSSLEASPLLNLQLDHNFSAPAKQSLLDEGSGQHKLSSPVDKYASSEQRFRLSGRVFTNPDIANRIPSVEGGEVSLEMRFK